MTYRHNELTREVERLVRTGINSDRICPSIATSWPSALQVATDTAEQQATKRH
jgi:hypothetical protein